MLSEIVNSIVFVLVNIIKNDYFIPNYKGYLPSFVSCADLDVFPMGLCPCAVGISLIGREAVIKGH